MREEEAALDRERRCRLQRAVLEAAGEVGYRDLAVRHVLARSGESRGTFYRHFESKADCYARAFEAASDRLCARLLEAGGSEGSWQGGLRAALEDLARLVEQDPLLARGVLVEVYVAGEPAMAKRKSVFERLSRAVDSARRENESRHSPPPIAADFILSAIETTAVNALIHGDPGGFTAAVPELARMATAVFFGSGSAAD